ncbi:hypothetical protein F4804DRAFT_103194 [Jackrogersella minutella]|nr:hypothetical protein F4804DRAFT_103194 [Jackrogersella minutella]
MGGQFSSKDQQRCSHYAHFAAKLDRIHFDGIYWTLFFLVICILFVSSWIYQSTMMYREKPEYREDVFRRKLKKSLAWCTMLFFTAAVILILEVFTLLALQFCDGEDLMSLYWSTWTMLQLGSEMAILGINLALWHHLCNVRQPLWALALGTPVLVVAGLGHLIHVALRLFYKKARARSRESGVPNGTSPGGTVVSSTSSYLASIKPEKEHADRVDRVSTLEPGQTVCFVIDVGEDERVRQWPSFVGTSDGKAIVQLTVLRP